MRIDQGSVCPIIKCIWLNEGFFIGLNKKPPRRRSVRFVKIQVNAMQMLISLLFNPRPPRSVKPGG
ncbi:hypothetical protein A4R26_06055 [Niastella populi]|uniref:Uncharacterized protein n=1 Tax=Niastella populi TaxID=550983 RepID=A0A1V9F555_9BACT|nr:hypothetical protein A4R26_06055 [Niastella populi]